jgi:hypothetical protein
MARDVGVGGTGNVGNGRELWVMGGQDPPHILRPAANDQLPAA